MNGKWKMMMAGALTGMMMMASAAVVSADVTAEEAKKAALDAVGLTEDQVIFSAEGREMDDGRNLFEVDFFIPGETKYEFGIDAATGAIVEQSVDLWEAEDDFEYAALIDAAGKGSALSGAETAVPGEITELMAKTIVLKDAGLNADTVTFTKCNKEMDDGVTRFEIEVRTVDGKEYDYDINAADGTILEKGMDMVDYDD